MFSYTRRTHPDAPELPKDWDQRGFDLYNLGMYNQDNKKIVFIDGCWSALYGDMAQAYGIFPDSGDQIYIGWRVSYYVYGKTTDGIKMFWERMGEGDSVYMALCYTADHGDDSMRQALWGPPKPNGEYDCYISPYNYDESNANIWAWSGILGGYVNLNPY